MCRPAVLLCACALVATACARAPDTPTIRVFAASSMTDVLPQIATDFEQRSDGALVELNFAGSSTLREQILDGAGADVFISANEQVMQDVVDAGLTSASPTRFAETSMTIAVPSGNPAQITSLADLANADLTVGLCASEVPCGRLADRVLADQNVAVAADTREPNVRALLSKVELGELDVALVYRTDVRASDEAEEIELPDGVGGRALYLAAGLDADSEGDESFISWLTTPSAISVLVDAGFEVP